MILIRFANFCNAQFNNSLEQNYPTCQAQPHKFITRIYAYAPLMIYTFANVLRRFNFDSKGNIYINIAISYKSHNICHFQTNYQFPPY